jgi:hypothetical protein
VILEERDESASLKTGLGALDRSGGDRTSGTLVVREDRRRRSKSISKEIHALQAERKSLQYEREVAELRGHSPSGEVVIARPREDSVEVVKDKKGRMKLVF